jgi:hypothetical protein
MNLFWIVFIGSYAGPLMMSLVGPVATGVLVSIAAIRATAWLRARSRARARASVAA